MAKQFRIYRPNKSNNGCASAWELSYKEENKYDPYMFFLIVAPQTGTDDNGNASFDWKEKSLTIKLGDADIGEIISVLEGRTEQVGSKGSLYHQSPNGGNKSLQLNASENGYFLKVSAQDTKKNLTGPYSHSISNGEAAVLLTLLKRAVEIIYGW